MKTAIIRIDLEVLRHALHLPDDVRIISVRDAAQSETAEFKLVSERFGDVMPGDLIPEVQAVYKAVDGEPVFVEFT